MTAKPPAPAQPLAARAGAAPPPRLRSVLYTPGDRGDRLEKALRDGAADLVLADLEDAVAPDRKGEARRQVAAAFAAAPRGGPGLRGVRINAWPGRLADEDLAAVVALRPDVIAVPKCEDPKAIDRQVQAPIELGSRDFDEALGKEGEAQFWEVQKASSVAGTKYPQLVASEGGTWEVRRNASDMTVRLVPLIHGDKVKPTGTTLGSTAIPPETAKNLYALLEGGARTITNIPADMIARMFREGLFGNHSRWSRWLRKTFTELDSDTGIQALDAALQGRRTKNTETFVAPILDYSKTLPKELHRDLAIALQNGTDLAGHEKLTQAIRKAFDAVGQRLVDEGMMAQATFDAHKGRYFPWANWTKGPGWQSRAVTPEGLVKMSGPQPVNLLDARSVASAASRLRARDSFKSIEEAEKHGLDISSHPVRDAVEALVVEQRAADLLQYFREIRDMGLAHKRRLVLPTGPLDEALPRDTDGNPLGYTQIPDEPVNSVFRAGGMKQPNGKTFGALAGHWVHDSVWSQLESYIDHRGEAGAIFDMLHTMTRKNVTVLRAGGHITQRLGNPLIAVADGIPWLKLNTTKQWGKAGVENRVGDLPKGLTVLVNGKEVAPTRANLLEAGVLQGHGEGARPGEVVQGKYRGLGQGGPSDALAKGLNAVEGKIPGADILERAYGRSDEVHRAGMYLYHRSIGADHAEAMSHVTRWYQMSNVPRGIKSAARWVSFFRFQYKMLANSKAILRETPYTFAKVGAAFAAARMMHRALLGMSDEEYEKALKAAVPGEGFAGFVKRTFTLPWITSGGRPGFWSTYNVLPQQSIFQGLVPTPAEDRSGGGFAGYLHKVGTYALGASNTVFKPIYEATSGTDTWSGGSVWKKQGITGESSQVERLAAMGRIFGATCAPGYMAGGVGVLDSTGLFGSAGLGGSRRPDSSGNFPSVFDKASEALGVTPKHPDYVAAKSAEQRESLDDNPDIYNEDGSYRVRHGVAKPEAKEARKAINAYSGGNGSLAEARGHRALAWLREGDKEHAAREIGSDSGRFRAMLEALSDADAEELRQLARYHDVVPARSSR